MAENPNSRTMSAPFKESEPVPASGAVSDRSCVSPHARVFSAVTGNVILRQRDYATLTFCTRARNRAGREGKVCHLIPIALTRVRGHCFKDVRIRGHDARSGEGRLPGRSRPARRTRQFHQSRNSAKCK
ncbi:hypothetical protein BRAS3809_850003 [Bradyrhizobium sp. STM 3809]|nr:hypothetical protein BRAS3809_850003 [Bradyrhizobium sp. STM 3809]